MHITQVVLESDYLQRQELLPPGASHLLLRDEQSLLRPSLQTYIFGWHWAAVFTDSAGCHCWMHSVQMPPSHRIYCRSQFVLRLLVIIIFMGGAIFLYFCYCQHIPRNNQRQQCVIPCLNTLRLPHKWLSAPCPFIPTPKWIYTFKRRLNNFLKRLAAVVFSKRYSIRSNCHICLGLFSAADSVH